jgi:exodeoxyribonuclease VII small subunit
MKPAKPEPLPTKFEAALEELQTIVGEMENAEIPLDELIARYERGMSLVQVCSGKLAEAEQKIEILTQKAGEPDPAKTASA